MPTNRQSIRDLMSRSTDHAGRLSAVPLRLGDSAPGDETIPDELEAVTVEYDATNKVATLTAVVALPTGTPDASGVTKAYNSWDLDLAPEGGDKIIAIRRVGVHTDGTHGQVDWMIKPTGTSTPVRIVTVDKQSGSQDPGDPVSPSSGRYFSGTLDAAGDIWIYLNDHHDDLVDSAGPTDQPWLPALSEWKGLLTGTYDPDPEGTSDERPVYKIDGIPHGVIPGFCATAFSAASGQGGASPTFTTGSFQTYIEDETGAWGYGPLLTGVMYNLEEGVAAGVVGFVHRGRGKLWLMPSCKVGSGYSS